MEQNIKLNINTKPTPRINTIDVLANAKPIQLNQSKVSTSGVQLNDQVEIKATSGVQLNDQAESKVTSKVQLNDQAENIASIKTPTNSQNPKINPAQAKPKTAQNINVALNQANQVRQASPQAPKAANANSSATISPTQAAATPQAKAAPQNIATSNTAKPQQNAQDKAPKAQPVATQAASTQAKAPKVQSASPQAAPTASTQAKQVEPTINLESSNVESKNDDIASNMSDNIGQVQNIHIENIEEPIIDNTFQNPNLESLKVNVTQLDFATTRKMRGYLKKLLSLKGSDLHLKAGSKIRARINGDIVVFSDEIFTKDEAITLAKELTRTRYPEFVQNKEMDMTYIYDTQSRFRVNMFFQMDGVSFAFRTIPTIQNTIDGLGLPNAIHNIVDMERGLVLVTGVTGSGKSTTLASIINAINHKHAKHIITIEDPIEFVHKDVKSIINQRSVGMDTNSFAGALKAALREDPDIILVGEMRDMETTEMALHAAETGHLVLSTLHTLDAKETINRIISIFPTTDQGRIRAVLSSTLNAIVSQRLLKSKDGKRTAAVELLFRTPRIEIIIAEGRDGEIMEALSEGKDIYQTQTFDQHLFELITNGVVDEEVALEKATSPSDLKLRLQNINYSERDDAGDSITLKS